MAIGQARNEFVQRSQGKNICHKASYIDRDRIVFEGTKFQEARTYDYSNREDPLAKRIMLPEGVLEKFKDPTVLWNAAEKSENRHDSQVGMELVIALPDDKIVTKEDRIELTERFAKQFVNKGLAAHYAIHIPDFEDHNWHAHILVPTRTFSKDGQSLHLLKDRTMQQELANTRWGEVWTNMQNDYFKELGLDLRVDPKGLTPQNHLGPVRLRAKILENDFEMKGFIYRERWEQKLKEYELRIELNTEEAKDPAKILKAVSGSQSVFSQEDVDRFMEKHTAVGSLQETREKFWKQKDLVQLLDPQTKEANGFYTTQEVLKEESRILRYSERLHDNTHIKLKNKHLNKFSSSFNIEQQQAYTKLAGREGLSILQGYAGTGKSHVLAALKDAYEAKGITVRGFGPDNATANLLKEKGFNAENVPRFLHAKHHKVRDLKAKEVWIVDEAGKLGNKSLSELLRCADTHKAKIILAGDSAQMSSVDRGGMFKSLAKKYEAAELKDIQRQNTQEQRDISIHLSKGQVSEAVDKLQEQCCIHYAVKKFDALELLINKWACDLQKDENSNIEDTIMIATSNRETKALNQAAHDIRHAQGEIFKEEYCCKTTSGEVIASKGDLIEFRKNDRELGVTNGLFGKLIDTKEDRFTVEISEKDQPTKLVSFDPKEYGAWQLGYASTTYRLQGDKKGKGYLLHNPNSSQQSNYVGLTRHVESIDLFVSSKECSNNETLKEQLSKDFERGNTVDYTHKAVLEAEKSAKTFELDQEHLRTYGGFKGKFKAFIVDTAHNIKDSYGTMIEKRDDRKEPQEFYVVQQQDIETKFGVSKVPEIIDTSEMVSTAIEAIEDQKFLKNQLQIAEDNIFKYEKSCNDLNKSTLYGYEKIFAPENENATIVLCSSSEAADRGVDHFCESEDHICVSWDGNEKSLDVDFSILEDRKVLVWGDHNEQGQIEQQEICSQLKEYDNMFVRAVDHDLMDEHGFTEDWSLANDLPDENDTRCDWYTCTWMENEAEEVQNSWKEIDKELENDRGMEMDI